ncbi:MAG: hypothetical protein J6L69_08030 [Lachnospiraceae bacterium]|nr:hypothetical protein [Lachnospiraceae bacterium]
MNFINKLERKYGKYAINNLTLYLMIAYAIGYVIYILNPNLYAMLELNPALVMKGQVWRLFTWVCTNPQDMGIFLIFMFFFYYWIGTTLERHWGTFKYNLYMFSGYFFMTFGAILTYVITEAMGSPINMSVSTYYINLASFLAFATLFSNVQVMLYMIIPLRIKWLAIVDCIFIGIELLQYVSILTKYSNEEFEIIYKLSGVDYKSAAWAGIFSIVMALLNFLIFFLATRNYRKISPAEIKRKREFKKAVSPRMGITKHKCAICGRSEEDDPNLSFRFCSKCEGNYEYCQDHLFTHEHVGLKKD